MYMLLDGNTQIEGISIQHIYVRLWINAYYFLWPLLLTWINFNPNMDK